MIGLLALGLRDAGYRPSGSLDSRVAMIVGQQGTRTSTVNFKTSQLTVLVLTRSVLTYSTVNTCCTGLKKNRKNRL